MRVLITALGTLLLTGLSACATHSTPTTVRCDRHLEPINTPVQPRPAGAP